MPDDETQEWYGTGADLYIVNPKTGEDDEIKLPDVDVEDDEDDGDPVSIDPELLNEMLGFDIDKAYGNEATHDETDD